MNAFVRKNIGFSGSKKFSGCLKILVLSVFLSSGSIGLPPDATTGQKIVRGMEFMIYTPLCLLRGICVDLNGEDDEF